jgi:hypothetical protein
MIKQNFYLILTICWLFLKISKLNCQVQTTTVSTTLTATTLTPTVTASTSTAIPERFPNQGYFY